MLEFKGKLVVVRRAQAVKPGKGGAFNQVRNMPRPRYTYTCVTDIEAIHQKSNVCAQVELKDIRTGTKYHERLRASESVERVRLDDEEEYDYLYRSVTGSTHLILR